jgi:hypothetical protein
MVQERTGVRFVEPWQPAVRVTTGCYRASWKTMPSDMRDPDVIVLTPWRMTAR